MMHHYPESLLFSSWLLFSLADRKRKLTLTTSDFHTALWLSISLAARWLMYLQHLYSDFLLNIFAFLLHVEKCSVLSRHIVPKNWNCNEIHE